MQFEPLSTDARPESVARLRHAAAHAAVQAGAVNGTVDQIRLAVSEAASNAVLHAYPDGGEGGEVRLEVQVDGDDLVVTVTDDGWGMRPRDDSPGLGLGLPLIGRLAARTEVVRPPDGGTRLCMRFPLGPAHV